MKKLMDKMEEMKEAKMPKGQMDARLHIIKAMKKMAQELMMNDLASKAMPKQASVEVVAVGKPEMTDKDLKAQLSQHMKHDDMEMEGIRKDLHEMAEHEMGEEEEEGEESEDEMEDESEDESKEESEDEEDEEELEDLLKETKERE